MFAGHIGAALVLAPAEPRLNVGALVAAALLLDVLLWLFILLGWESVTIPANFAATHQPSFVFPYSHGLAASVAWSAVAAAAGYLATRRARAAALLAVAVFSHWLLDALVHQPELPLLGAASMHVGLGAWQHLALALALEAGIVLAGLALFLRTRTLRRGKAVALAALAIALLAFTVAGMTVAPAPPSPRAMAASSLVTLLVVSALSTWLGSGRLVAAADLSDHAQLP